MKKKKEGLFECDSQSDFIDEGCLFPCLNEKNGDINIIDALDHIQCEVHKSKLSKEFWEECSEDITYMCKRLELNKNQVILLAIMAEIGDGVSWRQIGDFIGISRLKAMSFTPDIENFRKKRWIYRSAVHERMGMFDVFKLVRGVINSLRHNEKFIPENIEGLSEQGFVDRLTRYVCNEASNNSIPFEENNQFMMELVEANPQLPLCKEVLDLDEESSKIILLLEIADYARYFDTPNEGLCLHEIHSWFNDEKEFYELAKELQDGSHELFSEDILEHGCDDGMIDTERYRLTAKAKEDLLGEFKLYRQKRKITADRELIKHGDIGKKKLFYTNEELAKINRLKSLLSQDGLHNIQQRLAESGLRKGITCLFYGAPGTGKTETVYQIARSTGRNIMRVDVDKIKSCWVGESEKNIKSLFDRYRSICKNSEVAPILLFNEADAIINNRFETTRSSVEKMDNAMQNIILQELEELEGILIATTNLTGALDKAFDRRFLFKIEFSKPDLHVRQSIWRSLLPELGEEESKKLASEFDFSGGQIENIARKCKIEYAITGNVPALPQIQQFCREEYLNRSNRTKVGF